MFILKRVSNKSLLLLIIILIFFKIILFIAVRNELINFSLGGGSDADYYNDYTLGKLDVAVNIWPVILRYMNNIGIYSREFIPYIFLIANILFIPIMIASLADIGFNKEQKYYLYIFLLCLIYPSLYFFTFDIYRDVFMVLVFLIGCMVVKSCLASSSLSKAIFLFLIAIAIGWILTKFRPYLGIAFIGALLLWNIRFTKKRLILLSFSYLITLFFANYIGIFDNLTEYRAGFEENEAGSTLGLDFSNPILFIPNFIASILGQLFGFFITNTSALAVFLIETIPFLFMLIYIVRNIKFANNFLRFLIVFFVLYASIWLIGNDNLGTAVRLRIYNYLVIYICFFYILKLKRLSLKLS
ncbi:hypothetical protein [Psychrobacter sp. 16-MNA-CIBAN-0192]|uniref:hypothetical protein n=1 Tax=Psychrobacter sp. 16-MNA-CIBAN-0192 TaxID=3140448 RepID=UPI00332A6A58